MENITEVKIDTLPDAHPREGDPTAGDWYEWTEAVDDEGPTDHLIPADSVTPSEADEHEGAIMAWLEATYDPDNPFGYSE